MRLPSQPWLKIVCVATALVFTCELAYVYGLQFFSWIESDASVTALLADKVLQAKLPVVNDWYYANGDVWVLAPHVFALLPVAVLGVGPGSLFVAVLSGFLIEIALYTKVYVRLCGELWVAIFAAMVTMMAWSPAHIAFVYIQLACGFLTLLYMISFGSLAMLAASDTVRRSRWIAAGLFIALLVVQNPTRGMAFILAPLLIGCVWPWRAFGWRRRALIAAVATGGWILAFVIYTWLFQRIVSFSFPRGHIDFVVRDADGIAANVRMLLDGLLLLCGGAEALSLRAIPGLLLMVGAIILVAREVLSSRSFSAMRFLSVVVVAQLGGLLLPLLIGNLLVSPSSVRYLMPSLLAVYGLAAMLAARTLGDSRGWARALSTAWLVVVPIAALVGMPSAQSPVPAKYAWPDTEELAKVGKELARRGLTHGYSSILNSNILNLESRGASMTCSVYFSNVLLPQRWLDDTSCYTAAALPERFYVVADHDERDEASLRATLPEPAERFRVGDTYEVSVFGTADVSLSWLDLPLRDGEFATFPMRLASTHLALHRGKVALEGDKLIATGEEGYVIYGPYMKLPRGKYEVSWIGSGRDTPGDVTFIVAADVGKEELTRTPVHAKDLRKDRGELMRLSFAVDRMRHDVEFTVFSAGGARLQLDELVVEKKR
jgi:hypothetical protein